MLLPAHSSPFLLQLFLKKLLLAALVLLLLMIRIASGILLFCALSVSGLSRSSSSSSTMSSLPYLNNVEMGPPDAILGLAQAFKECTDHRKVNVVVGAYRDANGQPWVLPSVRAAERLLLEDNHEYLAIEGDTGFVQKALEFAYGDSVPLDRLAGVQSLSGTGACRIGGAFLAKFLPAGTRIYIPDPTYVSYSS